MEFCCPQCRAELIPLDANTLFCEAENLTYMRESGIWHLLAPEREEHFKRFLTEYATVRKAEGRWSDDPEYYRRLPFQDMTGYFKNDWRIRARSFLALQKKVIRPMTKQKRLPLHILDLGAGNGWLCNRLAQMGHSPVAVELRTDAWDGLGAAVHYQTGFEKVQAEFDRLPFARERFDVAVFNAAFHYSEDYETTLRETLRVLKADGAFVVLDSPLYQQADSGRQMVREQETYFHLNHGTSANSLNTEHFLTFDRLTALAETLGVCWQITNVFYGLKWHSKPLLAKLRRSREPAKFKLLVGKKR